ncbi:hypothetical protein [Candidatus Similichlamydia laticola]|uniref:Uncharacterized protein n=1 Tax=Candidatus Similichlamydia laticola TaxID=2170265 RepID=A0A369KL76_9BACT|nr:hypothetical protein [Candidatus Similichlamydia laticola]RDB31766.1 hypothetical protein HAT2_00146 [Candidatus Similichlamydia laticola]
MHTNSLRIRSSSLGLRFFSFCSNKANDYLNYSIQLLSKLWMNVRLAASSLRCTRYVLRFYKQLYRQTLSHLRPLRPLMKGLVVLFFVLLCLRILNYLFQLDKTLEEKLKQQSDALDKIEQFQQELKQQLTRLEESINSLTMLTESAKEQLKDTPERLERLSQEVQNLTPLRHELHSLARQVDEVTATSQKSLAFLLEHGESFYDVSEDPPANE